MALLLVQRFINSKKAMYEPSQNPSYHNRFKSEEHKGRLCMGLHTIHYFEVALNQDITEGCAWAFNNGRLKPL